MFPRWNSIHVSVFMYIYIIISPTIIVKIFLHIQRWTLIYQFQCFSSELHHQTKDRTASHFRATQTGGWRPTFWADVWNRPNWESVRKWWQIQIHEQHETCCFLLIKWWYIYIYMFIYVFWILDVRCTYAINFRDFQRWFLPRTVHVNVNMSWEMYVLFSPCCFVPRFSVFLWSLQIFMFAAVAVTSFCIHFRGSTYPPGHQIIELQSAMIELQPLKHWTNHDYMWTIIILRWLDRLTIKNN